MGISVPSANEKNDPQEDPYEVTLEPEDDPKNMATLRKWMVTLVISSGAFCTTTASSMVRYLSNLRYSTTEIDGTQAAFTEAGVSRDFHVSHEVSILGISLYVLGLGKFPPCLRTFGL